MSSAVVESEVMVGAFRAGPSHELSVALSQGNEVVYREAPLCVCNSRPQYALWCQPQIVVDVVLYGNFGALVA
jgi:hypothetical protein